MRGVWRLRRAWNRCFAHTIVLMYHRVGSPASDPQLLSVSPRNFAEQLKVLRNRYFPIHLSQFANNRLLAMRPGSVVVTFDDGYADNLFNAKPILEEHEIPATVFVTSGFVGSKQELFWDELAGLLLPQDGPDWNVLMFGDPTPRHSEYRELSTRLRWEQHGPRESILDDLTKHADVARLCRDSERPLNGPELQELAQSPMIEIGSHTVTHPALAMLEPFDQRREMLDSKASLEETTNCPVTALSYPFGTPKDYTDVTVRIARECGYKCACANLPSRPTPFSNRYQIPRFIVRNWDGDEFAKQLRTFRER